MSKLSIGKPDISPTTPSHVRGIRKGNQIGSMKRQDGIHPVGEGAAATARRSTGISPKEHDPIDPDMPRLTPP